MLESLSGLQPMVSQFDQEAGSRQGPLGDGNQLQFQDHALTRSKESTSSSMFSGLTKSLKLSISSTNRSNKRKSIKSDAGISESILDDCCDMTKRDKLHCGNDRGKVFIAVDNKENPEVASISTTGLGSLYQREAEYFDI